jgi:hypothetical protein
MMGKDIRAGGRPRRSGLRLVTEGELEGRCQGWDGATVFTLSNGEVWRQSAFRARTWHAACPCVRVWCCGCKYWLEVEGAGEILPVQRVC